MSTSSLCLGWLNMQLHERRSQCRSISAPENKGRRVLRCSREYGVRQSGCLYIFSEFWRMHKASKSLTTKKSRFRRITSNIDACKKLHDYYIADFSDCCYEFFIFNLSSFENNTIFFFHWRFDAIIAKIHCDLSIVYEIQENIFIWDFFCRFIFKFKDVSRRIIKIVESFLIYYLKK